MEVEPRFDYGMQPHETRLHKHGAVFESPTLTMALGSPLPLERSEEGVRARFALKAGQSATFVLETIDDGEELQLYSEDDTRQAFDDTVAYWRRWLSRSRRRTRMKSAGCVAFLICRRTMSSESLSCWGRRSVSVGIPIPEKHK